MLCYSGRGAPRFRRRHPKGSALFAVVAVVVVLITVLAAVHHQQMVARRAYNQAEAELRFREGTKFALREHLLGQAAPWDLKISAEIEDKTPESAHSIPNKYGKNLFQRAEEEGWTGLPDLKALEFAHAHRFIDLTPTTSDSSFRVFGARDYRLVESEIPGYAAYAPKGQVTLDEVFAWQNPTYSEEDKETLEAYSGVPAFIGAEENIHIDHLAYGEAHSLAGEVEIGGGAGIGFVGPLPLPAYEADLATQLQAADETLAGSTATGNKTSLIGGPRIGIDSMIDVFFGGDFNVETLLSLRQATSFPYPMIPGLSMIVPGLVWEFWFHVPYPPDGGFTDPDSEGAQRLQAIAQEQADAQPLVDQLEDELEAAIAKRKAAEAAYAADPSEENEDALDDAKDEEEDAREALEDMVEHLEDLGEEAEDVATEMAETGTASIPQTRAQDPSGRDGVFGWNYSKTLENMLGLLKDTLTGDFDNIAKRVTADVRVVHFGHENNVPEFSWGGSDASVDVFVSKASWTVPRGRTLRYDHPMEIRGDLWLQRGSVMMVNGNLKVVSPTATPSFTDAFKPSGRVFLEEGATLIVKGDFECQGSAPFGSIMVGSEPGEIHPITAAILVDGDARIPFGIYSGSTIEDLLPEEFSGFVAQLLGSGAPNFGKLAGPFHIRNCYFARFASTFQLVFIPPTLVTPPIFIPTPIPLPKENILVFVFRAMSFAYTGSLNLTLGENLYLHSDWWPFGDGSVPMALNIDPAGALAAAAAAPGVLASFPLTDVEELRNRLVSFAEDLKDKALDWVINEVVQKLVKEIAAMLTPGGFSAVLDPLMTAIIDAVSDEEEAVDDLYENFVADLETQVADAGQQLLANLLERTDMTDADRYLREYAGILVFARNIFIGSEARLATGMFVARDSIDIQADLTVGTLLALEGSVNAKDLLYYPYFNQASMYVPLPTPTDWLERAMLDTYGEDFDSGEAVQVGPPPVTHRIVAGGWTEE